MGVESGANSVADRLMALRLALLSSSRFWALRGRWVSWTARSSRAAVRSSEHARETGSMARIVSMSFLHAAIALAGAVVLAWATQQLGRFLYSERLDWSWAPDWLISATTTLGLTVPPGVNYQAIATAGLAVTGTLAAVYFATVSFVVSTTYRDATTRVRSLVTRIPQGRVYTLAYLQAVLFALAILLFPLVGIEPNRLTLFTLALLTALVLVSFGRLRTQLYDLLEPSRLLSGPSNDIKRWTGYVTRGKDEVRGRRASGSRARVLNSLVTLRDLCRLIRQREPEASDTVSEYAVPDARVLAAIRSTTAIWADYADIKHILVATGRWNIPRQQHKDWLTASDMEIGVALNTATSLQPNAADDDVWLERHLASVLSDLLRDRDAGQLAALTDDLSFMPRFLMAKGMFAEAKVWMDAVVQPGLELVATHPNGHPEPERQSARRVTHAHAHNLVDFVALSHTQLVLGLADYARLMARDFPDWVSRQAKGHAARRVGRGASALFRNLQDGLAFEKAVERTTVTSDANIHQLVARSLATELIDEATSLTSALRGSLFPWALELGKAPTPQGAAALGRLDEILRKCLVVLLPALDRCFAACESVHRDVDDSWPEHDTDHLKETITAMTAELRLPIARLASSVETELDPDMPDFFGWAFQRAHDDLLDGVITGVSESDLAERLRLLTAATDRATERLRRTVRRTHPSVSYAFRSEPLLLLLQVSGMAFVQAELNDREALFEPFAETWDALLRADAQGVLDLCILAIEADDQLLGISSGKMIRSSRQDRAMRNFEFLHDEDEFGWRGRRRRPLMEGPVHPLAVEVGSHLAWRGGFEEVFLAGWLLPAAIAKGAARRDELISSPSLADLLSRLASHDDEGGRADVERGSITHEGGDG